MLLRWLYLLVAILGTILPLSQLLRFLFASGFDAALFFRQLFQNNVSALFGLDVIVSSLALWLFVFSEGRRRGMKNLWLYIVCNLLVGVSLGLPLFLFFRERQMEGSKIHASTVSDSRAHASTAPRIDR